MNTESDAAKRVREADDEAERGMLAFLSGCFVDYMEQKYAAARKRCEERYAELSKYSPADR